MKTKDLPKPLGKVGGVRENSGRKRNQITEKAAEKSKELGILPHEWLLKVAQGEGIEHKYWDIKHNAKGKELSRELKKEIVYADFITRVDAAKAAAPFFAAKYVYKTVSNPAGSNGSTGSDVVAEQLKEISKKLPV
jgi:hypothetical protein